MLGTMGRLAFPTQAIPSSGKKSAFFSWESKGGIEGRGEGGIDGYPKRFR